MGASATVDVQVENRIFEFPGSWSVTLYDKWPQYQRTGSGSTIQGQLDATGVDVLTLDGNSLWLIEMKDYAYRAAVVPQALQQDVPRKIFDTLGALYALAKSSTNATENHIAANAISRSEIHAALHIEIRPGDGHQLSLLPSLRQAIERRLAPLELASFRLVTSAIPATEIWKNSISPQESHRYT